MRLLVVGAGATGGYFGGRLAAAGRDVTFLIRPKRAAEIAKNGFVIADPKGETRIEPKIVTADALRGSYDLVLMSVKAYSLLAAMDDIAPVIGPDTLILPVLNGLKHFDVLSERFGAERVIGSFCKINARLDDHGRIIQMSPLHDLIYGEYDGKRSPRIEAIDAFFKGAGFDARLSDDIGETKDLASAMPEKVAELQARWDAWNATLVDPLWGGGPKGEKKFGGKRRR